MLASSAYGEAVTGTVIELWSDPLVTGNLLLSNGQTQFYDNTATGQYHFNNSPEGSFGSALTYGISSSGGGQPFSVLTFFGNTLTSIPLNTPVLLGTITFLNGTSDLPSLIFGAKLTLTVKGDSSVDPLIANVSILRTQNTNFDVNFDADVFYFDVLFPQTFNVYEGNNATMQVYGMFVNDPQIELTAIELVPGETGGFIGNGIPSPVPQPATMFISLAGLCGIALSVHRRRNP